MIRENGTRLMAVAGRNEELLGSSMSERTSEMYIETPEGSESVRRALLTKLLVDSTEQARVVIDRRELGRLFERRRDDIAWEVFSPRLWICDFLEDAIEHLEAELAEADARPVGEVGGSPCTCWFTTPDVDFDVVLQTLQRTRSQRFVGLLFGPWPHVSVVYVLEDAMRPQGLGLSRRLSGIPATTEEEAFRALISCRI